MNKPIIVRIVRANSLLAWYRARVGDEVAVYNYSKQHYILKEDYDRASFHTRLIQKSDTEIVETP